MPARTPSQDHPASGHGGSSEASSHGNSFAATQLHPHAEASSRPGPGDAGGLGKGKQQFGRLSSMVAFQERLGQFIGTLVGSPGDTLSVEIGAEVSVEGVVLGLSVKGHAARTHDGFELGGQAKMEIGVGEVGDSGTLSLTAGMDASGDSAAECANLWGLGLEQTLREKQFHAADLLDGDFWAGVAKDVGLMSATGGAWGVFAVGSRIMGDKIADVLWGKDYAAYVAQNMDEDDEVSRSIGVGVEGELEGISGGADYEHRDVISAKDGELDKHAENDLTFSLAYKHKSPPFSFSGSLSATFPLDREERAGKGKLKIKASNSQDMAPGVDAAALVRNGVLDVIKGLCTQGGKLDLGWVGRLIDGAEKAMSAAAGLVTGSSDLEYALSIDTNGKVGFSITSTTSLGADVDLKEKVVGVKVDASLERTVFETSFDVGPMKPGKALGGTSAGAQGAW